MKEIRSLIVEINKNGKSHITAKCPFCGREFNVITWNSFYSRNNKCSCGALLEKLGCIKEAENDIKRP